MTTRSSQDWIAAGLVALTVMLEWFRGRDRHEPPAPCPEANPEVPTETILGLFSRVVEIQKARMSLQLALFAAAATLTAAGFELKNPSLFVLAGFVVPLALACDLITKNKYMSPVLYKLAMCEIANHDTEPMALLFAAYNKKAYRRFRQILSGRDALSRRLAFRRMYTLHHIGFKLVFFSLILAAEATLAFVFRDWFLSPSPGSLSPP